MKPTVLIVDDEPDVVTLVEYNLENAGCTVQTANDGEDGLEKARDGLPDLILLDVMMPAMDGIEVCKLLRRDSKTAGIPIIMLTARASEIDRVVGLELGADDYVTKPFSPRELVLRVKKLLHRARLPDPQTESYRFGELSVDVPRHLVTVGGDRIELTAMEFKLLITLIHRRGHVQTREALLRQVWDYDKGIETRTVDTHVRRLRDKLGGDCGKYLDTVRGVGYRFMEV